MWQNVFLAISIHIYDVFKNVSSSDKLRPFIKWEGGSMAVVGCGMAMLYWAAVKHIHAGIVC